VPKTKFPDNNVDINVRCRHVEAAAIHKGADILHSNISSVMEYAAVEAAHKLGVYDDEKPPPKKPKTRWALLPDRDEGSADERITISVPKQIAALIHRAAEYVSTPGNEVSAPLFAIGATLGYLAGKKERARKHINKSDRVDATDPKLAKLVLPQEYEKKK
jgi:uncharacterized protein (DUF1778 family)